MNMREQLEKTYGRFVELEQMLQDPVVLADGARYSTAAREHGSLAKLANKYRRFRELNAQISETLQMTEGNDAELRELAEAELPELRGEREQIWRRS